MVTISANSAILFIGGFLFLNAYYFGLGCSTILVDIITDLFPEKEVRNLKEAEEFSALKKATHFALFLSIISFAIGVIIL
jgi:hypothetical protein